MHKGHRDRLRERFRKEGLDHFEPHNVLELLLFYAIPRRDTNEIAHHLLDRFGSFSAVLDAPIEELLKIPGVGENTAVFLKVLPAVSRRYLDDRHASVNCIDSIEKAGAYLLPKFIGRSDEVVYLLALDGKCRIRYCGIIAEGVVNEVNINMRGVIEIVMRHKATSAIIAHNHPAGVALPSESDVETTWHVKRALEFVGIRLVDHIIVADSDFVSMRDSHQYANIFSKRGFNEPDTR